MTDERKAFQEWFSTSGFWNDAITEKAWMAALAWQAARATPADQAAKILRCACGNIAEARSAHVDALRCKGCWSDFATPADHTKD